LRGLRIGIERGRKDEEGVGEEREEGVEGRGEKQGEKLLRAPPLPPRRGTCSTLAEAFRRAAQEGLMSIGVARKNSGVEGRKGDQGGERASKNAPHSTAPPCPSTPSPPLPSSPDVPHATPSNPSRPHCPPSVSYARPQRDALLRKHRRVVVRATGGLRLRRGVWIGGR
jgi:hypothetical protein